MINIYKYGCSLIDGRIPLKGKVITITNQAIV